MGKSPTGEPVVALAYGPSGLGKTTDLGYSFPRALFLAAPGSLASIEKTCGYKPNRHFVATIPEATQIIEAVGDSDKYDTIVIDDFSFMAEQTFSSLEQDGLRNFKLWGKMRDLALEFRNKSRYCGVNVLMNAWENPPKTRDDGTRIRGGPQLSGKLPESIPALCDVVLRAVQDPKREPWPVVYRCTPDSQYVMKDRYHVSPRVDPCPMNMGEILRAAGFEIDRREEWPDQEEQVAALAQSLKGNMADDREAANEAYTMFLEAGHEPNRARWTVRDALDRALIRNELAEAESSFFSAKPSTVLL